MFTEKEYKFILVKITIFKKQFLKSYLNEIICTYPFWLKTYCSHENDCDVKKPHANSPRRLYF